jgi:hypothetical protein
MNKPIADNQDAQDTYADHSNDKGDASQHYDPMAEDELRACPMCHRPKPTSEYCPNECQYLIDAKFEDAIPSILGRWHGNSMKATEAYYQIEYLFNVYTTNKIIEELVKWMGIDDYGEIGARIKELKALNHREDEK